MVNTGTDHGFFWHHYWNISIPGLTEAEAQALVARCEIEYGKPGSTVDPQHWLTVHLDVTTAEAMVAAIRQMAVSDAVQAGLREILEEWLESRPSDGQF